MTRLYNVALGRPVGSPHFRTFLASDIERVSEARVALEILSSH